MTLRCVPCLPVKRALIEINADARIGGPLSRPRLEITMDRSHADPAERSGYLRFFYRDWRPTRLGRAWTRFMAWVAGTGLAPDILVNLETTRRGDGRRSSNVLAAVQHQGRRYLVSMLGDGSEWVRNVRAARGAAFIKRGRSRPVRLAELPPEARAPILKAWSQVATSGRAHLPVPHDAPLSAFEAIAGDYPVFRIDPDSAETEAARSPSP